MFLGQRTTLTAGEQALIATWAFKTHLMAQFLHVPFRAPPDEQLRSFHRDRRPPPKCRVWLGAFAAEPLHRVWGRTSTFKLEPPTSEASLWDVQEGEAMTLCIGQLVLNTFHRRLRLQPTPELARLTTKIWPANAEVEWPPASIVTDEATLRQVATGFVTTDPSR
jgi:hypothetical protein